MKTNSKLLEIAIIFFKLGAFGFGGPIALIAMMETEIVQKRQWVTRKYFMDMLAATNLVPGPNAVEMAIHLGQIRAGLPGLIVAGFSFLFPPTVITLLLSIAYVNWGSIPKVQFLFYGIAPVVISIIIFSGIRIGRSALNSRATIFIAIICLISSLNKIDEVLIIFTAGVLGLATYLLKKNKENFFIFILFFSDKLQNTFLLIHDKWLELGIYFLKIGFILYGSGLVLFAYIHNDMVNNFKWLTERQLLDAIAFGQFTPGPVSSSVTFIGYLVGGLPGALISTLAIFVPSFLVVMLLGKIMPKLIKSPIVQSIFKGVNAGVVALIFSVCLSLLKSSVIDYLTLFILILSLFTLLKYKIDPIWLIICGASIGFIKSMLI